MAIVTINTVGKHEDQSVTICGWLTHKRSSGRIRFLVLRDGTGIIQATLIKGETDQQAIDLYPELTQESSLAVTGTVRRDQRAPGGYEILVAGIEVFQIAETYPIAPKEHGVGFLMDHRHLWLRSPRQRAILRIRHTVIDSARKFFDDQGFTLLDAPILTPSSCEGTTTLFETDYFGNRKAFLSQSGQLYMEAGAMAFGKVYCCGPTFRAEKSKTRRHLTEFWMIEPEIAFADLGTIMGLAEGLILAIVEAVLKTRQPELQILKRDVTKLEQIQPPFHVLRYDEALQILRDAGESIVWGQDFGGGHETMISNHFDKPVLIHRYPAETRAFYMKNDPDRPEVALCMDVLAPEGYGEIIGGGQREDVPDILEQKIQQAELPAEDFAWYVDLRRYGSVPHAGFGLGIERTVAWICGLEHVREAIPFPRLLDRLHP
ncbi:MAG: asparagine--tRNA ligase [Deltaproteobacteria bacterium]|nr:asparagine--tRNA ligase [Deltaproteobacteria bacterium]MBW2019725.1 asparagine--tRNA ligase [Deltaproteobacteria bacterium]MBW2073926.1 asparagine--tRNA ligase [Deltaproteobacteria bacterium]